MLKLNGGLGTGMGLEKAKSLLPLKGDDTFLDFIAKQVSHMRTSTGVDLAFMLMNSFATSADTLAHLEKYPLATQGLPLEFQQNKAPKVTADGFAPATWAANPACEWCPPGHGDLYPAMVGSGTLDALIAKGFKYMFVSNSDNLGATMDLKLRMPRRARTPEPQTPDHPATHTREPRLDSDLVRGQRGAFCDGVRAAHRGR